MAAASFSPIIRTSIQAALLSGTSNILAQLIRSYNSNQPFHIDYAPILQFLFFTLLNTPPNVLWQQFIEQQFPGYDIVPAVVDKKERDDGGEKLKEIIPRRKLNVRNTAIKFGLDQTVGATVNTIIFVAAMAYLRGERDLGVIWDKVVNDSWPLMRAGYRLWPIVSILQFTVVPPRLRILVGNLVGMGWGIFLSLFANH